MTLTMFIVVAVVLVLVLLALREANREAESTLPLRHAPIEDRRPRAQPGLAPRRLPTSALRDADRGKKKAI